MKRLFGIIAAVLLLGACAGKQAQEGPVSVDFHHTGCGRGEAVKADAFGEEIPELTLEYTDGGLFITRTNAILNCSIGQGGISCDLTVTDNVINYKAYETDGATLKCVCPVEQMTALVTGLREKTEYILNYTCDGSYRPITFYYAKGLKITLDLTLYKE